MRGHHVWINQLFKVSIHDSHCNRQCSLTNFSTQFSTLNTVFPEIFIYLIIHFSNFHVVLISEEPMKPSMLRCASPIIQLFKFRNKSTIRN